MDSLLVIIALSVEIDRGKFIVALAMVIVLVASSYVADLTYHTCTIVLLRCM
jgi:hypothetical protein